MEQSNLKIWTPEEIANMTQTSIADVLAELQSHRLPGFRIGNAWRVSDETFRLFIAGIPVNVKSLAQDGPPSASLDLEYKGEWCSRKGFPYTWPDGKTTEQYDTAFEIDLVLSDGHHSFRIGYANRKAAGQERRRAVVFLVRGSRLIPIVEFAGANDFETTRRLASVIKDRNNRHVRSAQQLPVEYQGMPIAIYSDVVTGPYAARSVAIVVDENEKDLMLRHALIRAHYKGLAGEYV